MTNKTFPKVIGFRTCKPNGVSPSDDAKGFTWPDTGPVTCQDWDPKLECGNGLHALLVGQNSPGVWYEGSDAVYKVLEIDSDPENLVDLEGKVKFRTCNVLFSGNLLEASAYLAKYAPGAWYKVYNVGGNYSTNTGGDFSTNIGGHHSTNTGSEFSTNTGGDRSTNTGGNRSINTGGYRSTNTGGNYSRNTGGNNSTNTGGYRSTNTGGNCSINTGGNRSINTGGDDSTNTGGYDSTNTGSNCSTNTGGNCSTNTGGDDSKNTGGDYSTNTGGKFSTNTGGNDSTNIGGHDSQCQGGEDSTLSIKWVDDKGRTRLATAYTGEDEIEADVMYKLDSKGKFIKV